MYPYLKNGAFGIRGEVNKVDAVEEDALRRGKDETKELKRGEALEGRTF